MQLSRCRFLQHQEPLAATAMGLRTVAEVAAQMEARTRTTTTPVGCSTGKKCCTAGRSSRGLSRVSRLQRLLLVLLLQLLMRAVVVQLAVHTALVLILAVRMARRILLGKVSNLQMSLLQMLPLQAQIWASLHSLTNFGASY